MSDLGECDGCACYTLVYEYDGDLFCRKCLNDLHLRPTRAGVRLMETEVNTQRPVATVATFTSIDARNKIWGVSWESSTLGPPPAPGTEIEVTKKDQTRRKVRVGVVHKQVDTRYVLTIDGEKRLDTVLTGPSRTTVVELPNSPF